jgi:hypothetical protein
MSSWCGSPCPLRVKSGRDVLKFRCPLYPRKRTFAHAIRMSALGHKRTLARADRYDVNKHRHYKPSVTSAQPRMVLLLRNSMTLGSNIAGRSCVTTTVATMASQ